jgi:quinol monooxygenase YgiN
VIARLPVDYVDAWLAEFERMHPVREQHGDLGRRRVLLDADDPGTVVVVFDWDDLDRARAYFGSPALAASVERAGGRAAPQVTYLQSLSPRPPTDTTDRSHP